MIHSVVKLKRSEFGPDFRWQSMFSDIRTGKKFILLRMDRNGAVYTEENNEDAHLIIENDSSGEIQR